MAKNNTCDNCNGNGLVLSANQIGKYGVTAKLIEHKPGKKSDPISGNIKPFANKLVIRNQGNTMIILMGVIRLMPGESFPITPSNDLNYTQQKIEYCFSKENVLCLCRPDNWLPEDGDWTWQTAAVFNIVVLEYLLEDCIYQKLKK